MSEKLDRAEEELLAELQDTEPLGELRPVEHLPGHTASEWKPWPPPDDWPPEDNVIIRTTEGDEHRAWKGDWREDTEWRDEASGKKLRSILSTSELAALRWKSAGKAEDEDETPPSAYQAARDRSFAALSELSRLARALPEDGKETRAEAVVAGLIAHQLSQALTAAQTALDLARDPDFSDED